MYKLRPLFKRIIVFCIEEREKIAGSVLYRGNSKRGMRSRTEDVWIHIASEDCKDRWEPGTRGLLPDAMEFYNESIDDFVDEPTYPDLLELAQATGGKIRAKLIPEGAIVGVVPRGTPLQEVESSRDGVR